jgi:pimeloyl-ACP methyl ester carboxylesterase
MPSDGMNAEFFARYDALLARWPVAVEPIDIPGRYGTTHVNACGSADGPPVVLLHGGRATSTVWYGNVAALSQRHRVYAIDGIGDAGRSVDDGKPLVGVDGFVNWIDETFDALGVTSATVVGHSLGTWIAMQYALHAPTRVDRLALLDPTDCLSPTRISYRLRAIPLFVGRSPDRWRSFFRWETHGHDVDAAFLDLWASPFRASWTRGTKLPLPLPRPPAAAIAALPMPMLVVVAGRSRQNDARRLARAAASLPRASVLTLPDATHFTLPQEYPAEINAAISDLLERPTAQSV